MAEKRFIIQGKKVAYAGLIDVQGLYKQIKGFMDRYGYAPNETDNKEEVYEDGKQIMLVLKGAKKLSDFAKIEWKVKLNFYKIQEMTVEKDGVKLRLHKGKTDVKSDMILVTDYDGSFEQTAFQYFMRVIIDKYIFKSYLSRAGGVAKKDYVNFEGKVKDFLNMERFK